MDSRRAVKMKWKGSGFRFRGGGTHPETPEIDVDGSGEEGPSPMLALLLAAGGCSGADVVMILEKMRVELSDVEIEVEGVRAETEPKRYVTLRFHFKIAGKGLDEEKAKRAVDLSMEKYCSVVHSLAPDIEIAYGFELA
ncbi:MAG: OsmC family protein [Gemmatimonadota bacterium]|nr:OsmC family protein [Gemmatimonadota bacterium]MDH5805595.1 OsmC family protein [Gemmatimonadota bacterium]